MNYESHLSDSLIEENEQNVQLPNFLFESGRNQINSIGHQICFWNVIVLWFVDLTESENNDIRHIKFQIYSKILTLLIYTYIHLSLVTTFGVKELYQQEHLYSQIILKFILIRDENNISQQEFVYNLQYIEIWLYITVIHSFIVMIQYRVIQKYLNKYSIILPLAIEMELINIINIEQGLDQQQRQQQIQEQNDYQNQQLIGRLLLFDQRNIFVSKLSQELYEKLLDKFKCLKILNKFMVLAFFFIELFALIILFDSHSILIVDRRFYYLCIVYMILVVIFGLNQYFSTFTLAFLWIVFFPVFISYEIYMWFKKRKEKKIEKKKILDTFEEILLDQKQHQLENNDCAICMQSFQAKDQVIILSCSDKHVFHTDCIVDWLKLNTNCPLCRKQVQWL